MLLNKKKWNAHWMSPANRVLLALILIVPNLYRDLLRAATRHQKPDINADRSAS